MPRLAKVEPEPTGVIITDRLLSEADIAMLRKAVQEYDGSIPLAEYLEKRLSIGIEYINFGSNEHAKTSQN